MIQPWTRLHPQDRETVRVVTAFLNNRLTEESTIDWAIRLKPEQQAERIAIEELIGGLSARDLKEPWATAWRLIEESWLSGSYNDHGTAIYAIRKRLRGGDRSGAAVSAIVALVEPRLEVNPIEFSAMEGR